MSRPNGIWGLPQPYLPSGTGETLYDTPIGSLPPLTASIRQAWGVGAYPVATPEALAAIFVAVHALETRLIALGG
jgi:hypothetical protein